MGAVPFFGGSRTEHASGGARVMSSLRIGRMASALAVIGLAAFAPSAAGAFGAPVDVSTQGGTDIGQNPQVATDATGDSALTWEFNQSGGAPPTQRVQGRTISSAGVLGPVHELGGASDVIESDPEVAIDATGDAVFVWVESSQVVARRLSAGGTLGPPIQVGPGGVPSPGLTDPEVATDANGDTIFAWMNRGSNITGDFVQARTMTSRGVLGPIRAISGVGGNHQQVATDATGHAVLTWVDEDGVNGDTDTVQARTMSRNGSLGPLVNLDTAAGRTFAPQVATDADGDTIFTWLRFDGVRDRVRARTMSAAGVFGAVFDVTTSGPSALDPQVATDATGDSVFTWERFEANNDRVQARTRIAGVLGGINNLSAVGGDAFAPQVASDADGDSVVTWVRFDAANGVDLVQALVINAAGGLGSVQTLSAAGADAETPQVAVAANTGAAVVTWERADVIQASRGP